MNGQNIGAALRDDPQNLRQQSGFVIDLRIQRQCRTGGAVMKFLHVIGVLIIRAAADAHCRGRLIHGPGLPGGQHLVHLHDLLQDLRNGILPDQIVPCLFSHTASRHNCCNCLYCTDICALMVEIVSPDSSICKRCIDLRPIALMEKKLHSHFISSSASRSRR